MFIPTIFPRLSSNAPPELPVSGFGVQDSGFRIQGSGFRVQGSGFRIRVQGSGFRVQGLGCEIAGIGENGCVHSYQLPTTAEQRSSRVARISLAKSLNSKLSGNEVCCTITTQDHAV